MNSDVRQGREVGTDETWRVVLASWNGDEIVADGESIRVPKGVNSRGFLIMTLQTA